jgi:hypothetical protein
MGWRPASAGLSHERRRSVFFADRSAELSSPPLRAAIDAQAQWLKRKPAGLSINVEWPTPDDMSRHQRPTST